MEILLWIVGIYLFLGFLTALFISKTTYSENGLLRNTLFAALYWVAAIRGLLQCG